MYSIKKRGLSLAMALVMMLFLLPGTASGAETSLFPNDPNYVELDSAGHFFKMMQNKETFNGVIYLKGCPTTSSLKVRIQEFREKHNDIIYGAEVHSGGYGQLASYLRPVVYSINELTGERAYPKDINVYIMFRVENGVLVRAKTWDTPKVTTGYVWLGETENMPGEQDPILPEDKAIKNITVNSPTREQIVSMWRKLGLDRPVQGSYEQMPSLAVPYAAGKLPHTVQAEALNAVNFMRYIAGIDYNVNLNDDYIQYSQDAALVMAVNNEMTHFPTKPADMDEAIYKSGSKGAANGNLAIGFSTMQDVVISGWMADSDGDNPTHVGHRRWVLNPKMSQTGFGRVDKYSAMYSIDNKNSSATYDGVAWPAQNMPIEYFNSDYSWSISFDKKLSLPKEDVSINLTRLNDGEEWSFSGQSGFEFYDGVVYPYTTGMGQRNCIVFKPKHINIGLNEVYRVRINDRKGTTYFQYFVTFFSLNNVDASITSDSGLIPAKTPAEFDLGTALKPIKKTDPNNYPQPLPAPAPNIANITLDKAAATLEVGKTLQLTAIREPADAQGTISYTSSNNNVAIVTPTGLITARQEGSATIAAKVGSLSAICVVTVEKPSANGITLNRTVAKVESGKTIQLTSTLIPAGATDTVIYTSSDTTIATVNDIGLVTGKKAGTATITAKVGSLSAKCVVTVAPPTLTGITLAPAQAGIKVGQSTQLEYTLKPAGAIGTVSYSSSNTAVATVSATGLVTGKKAGTATITAKVGNLSATCKITVSNINPTGINLDKTNATLEVGKTLQLTAALIPAGAGGTVSYSSSNTAVATVSATGLVTGKKAGTATITAKVGNLSATCKITVSVETKKPAEPKKPEAPTPSTPAPATSIASPSPTKLEVNDKSVAVDSYMINNNNYIKLRDLAAMINGTVKNFEVTWDQARNAINLKTGSPYTPAGGEMTKGGSGSKTATLTTSAVFVNGAQTPFTAYNINGNNYFKLRDVMKVFDIYVGYEATTGTATLDTSKGYEDPSTTPNTSAHTILDDGVYKIRPAADKSLILDINEGSKDNGAAVILWSETGGNNQKFTLTSIGSGRYTLTALHSNKTIGASGKGDNLVQSTVAASFTLVDNSNGTYCIQDENDLYVGVSGGKMKHGTALILWTKASDKSQSFVLEKQ